VFAHVRTRYKSGFSMGLEVDVIIVEIEGDMGRGGSRGRRGITLPPRRT